MSRRVRYQVAASLDGYIAGPGGEYDWIPNDPDIDFGALFKQFDTMLMGRKTYEGMLKADASGGGDMMMKTVVFSRTLKAADHPKVTIVSDGIDEAVGALKQQPGKDIWLFGGGELFRSLAERGLVDTVEIAVVPKMLGGGVPLNPAPGSSAKLELTRHQLYPKSGIMLLEYNVIRIKK